MKKLTIFSLIFALIASPVSANVTITQLPAGSAAASGSTDVFPFVNISTNTTEKMELSDLINLPSMVATYAPLINPVFPDNITANQRIFSTYNHVGPGGGLTIAPSVNTNSAWFEASNLNNTSYFGNESSTAGGLFSGTSAYATVIANTSSQPIQFFTNSAKVVTFDSSQNIQLTGSITAGTWHGTAIGAQYGGTGIDSHSSTGVPTISSGTWSVNAQLPSSVFPALTGDVTTSAGSLATSLVATSNATLTTLSALSSASSLATIGTIGTGVWHGTAVGAQYGGTGIDSHSSTGVPTVSSGTWSITGTTGNTNSSIVYSGSPTLSAPTFTGTTSASAITMTGALTQGSSGQLVADTSGNLKTSGNMAIGTSIDSTIAMDILTTTLTGATEIGVQAGPTYSSSTTSAAYDFASDGTTAAASFILTNFVHFGAFHESPGSGSTITRETGFYCTQPTAGTNDACFTDNVSYTGNYFINQSGSAASKFGGVVSTAAVTANRTNDSSTSTPRNNLSSATGFTVFTGSATITINGIAAGTDGQQITLTNSTGNNLTVVHQSGSATGAQILCPSDADLTIPQHGGLLLVYDGSGGFWRAVHN